MVLFASAKISGPAKSIIVAIESGIGTIIRYGLSLPKRVLVLSIIEPISGSFTVSQIPRMKIISATASSGIPKTFVKNNER